MDQGRKWHRMTDPGPTPSLLIIRYAKSSLLFYQKMDTKLKCKKCRKGVLEPTFNSNEMRCFLCGWTIELEL
jgi:hypothetical protein